MKSLLLRAFLSLLILGFLFPGSVLTWFAVVNLVEETSVWWSLRPARSWPVHDVKILDAKKVPGADGSPPWPSRVECQFEYQIGGKTYTVVQNKFSGRYSFFSTNLDGFAARLKADPVMLQVMPGEPIEQKARVNPADPQEAYLTIAFDDTAMATSLLFSLDAASLGISILLLVFGLLYVLIFRMEEPPPPAAGPERLTPGRVARVFWLWLGLLMTPGTIPGIVWLVPALLRQAARWHLWIPVSLQLGLAVLFWWLYFRNRRWLQLAGDSYIELDGQPITIASAPSGRFVLAPTKQRPPSVRIDFELSRRVTSKHFNVDFKTRREAPLTEGGPSDGWYPIREGGPVTAYEGHPHQERFWSITVRGRFGRGGFKLLFVRKVQA